MLALVAGAKLVEMSGEAQDAVSGQHGAQQLLAAMASTEVYLAHAIAVLAVLRLWNRQPRAAGNGPSANAGARSIAERAAGRRPADATVYWRIDGA
jgi:hypothetical protein